MRQCTSSGIVGGVSCTCCVSRYSFSMMKPSTFMLAHSSSRTRRDPDYTPPNAFLSPLTSHPNILGSAIALSPHSLARPKSGLGHAASDLLHVSEDSCRSKRTAL